MVSCSALTAQGRRCRGRPVAGGTRCAAHGGRRGVVEAELVGTVVEAARGDWRAAAWILERRFPQRWRRGHEVEGREPEPAPLDGLDELAGKREARRAGG